MLGIHWRTLLESMGQYWICDRSHDETAVIGLNSTEAAIISSIIVDILTLFRLNIHSDVQIERLQHLVNKLMWICCFTDE